MSSTLNTSVNYISETTRLYLSSREGRPANAKFQYIFTREEAVERHVIITDLSEWVIGNRIHYFRFNVATKVCFAVVSSSQPFQILRIPSGEFIVLIDCRKFWDLFSLCLRLQALPPLTEVTSNPFIKVEQDYTGQPLLVIARHLVNSAGDLPDYVFTNRTTLVFRAALTHIFGHELAHAAHGHMDFISSPEFLEVSSTEDDKNLTYKALEMDADCSATSGVFEIFENHIQLSLREKDSSFMIYSDKFYIQLIRKSYILGIYLSHLFMDVISSNHYPEEHPFTYFRFLSSQSVLQQLFLRHSTESINYLEEVRLLFVECFINLSGDLQNLGHPFATNMTTIGENFQQTHEYQEMGIQMGLNSYKPCLRRWSRIRPALVKYHRGGVLAPATEIPF